MGLVIPNDECIYTSQSKAKVTQVTHIHKMSALTAVANISSLTTLNSGFRTTYYKEASHFLGRKQKVSSRGLDLESSSINRGSYCVQQEGGNAAVLLLQL